MKQGKFREIKEEEFISNFVASQRINSQTFWKIDAIRRRNKTQQKSFPNQINNTFKDILLDIFYNKYKDRYAENKFTETNETQSEVVQTATTIRQLVIHNEVIAIQSREDKHIGNLTPGNHL